MNWQQYSTDYAALLMTEAVKAAFLLFEPAA
jgi:hypothetical protein